MKFRTTCAIIFRGDRIRKGAVIEATADEAAELGTDVAPVSAEPAPEPAVDLASIPLEQMSYAQLKARAKELELSQAGTSADLKERIELHLAGNADDQSQDGQGGEQGEGEPNADDQSQDGQGGEVTSE